MCAIVTAGEFAVAAKLERRRGLRKSIRYRFFAHESQLQCREHARPRSHARSFPNVPVPVHVHVHGHNPVSNKILSSTANLAGTPVQPCRSCPCPCPCP
jgi:hypothetical protein